MGTPVFLFLKKQNPIVCSLKKKLKYEDTNRILKQWKETHHANSNQIKSHIIDNKVVVKAKSIIKDKKDNFIILKKSVPPELITILNT